MDIICVEEDDLLMFELLGHEAHIFKVTKTNIIILKVHL